MQISPAGVLFVKSHEGLRLKAYRDLVGLWTIGYGHTLTAKPGIEITEHEADGLLVRDLVMFSAQVMRLLAGKEVTQGQFDALVSFAFNVGAGNLGKSTLLKKLLAGDIPGAADQFSLWTGAGTLHPKGLIERREAEREMFLG